MADDIARDARFADAAHAICTGILACHASSLRASTLVSDRAQYHVASVGYVLDPAITLAATWRLMPAGLASRNRVSSYLQALERCGALERVASPQDRRLVVRRLSPWLSDWLGDWGRAIMAPALPWVAGPVPDLADRDMLRDAFHQFVLAQQAGIRMLMGARGVARGMSLRGGGMLMLDILQRHYRPGSGPFSRKAFAERFSLSRSHVIDLVNEFVASGWMAQGAQGPTATAMLVGQGRIWHSSHLAVAVLVMERRLMAALPAGPAD